MSKSNKNNVETILKELITRFDSQYNELDKRLDNIEKVMIAQEINLRDHMKRSDTLEDIMEQIKENDLKPLQKHVHYVEGVFKFLGLVALIVGLASGIISLLGIV
jgi:hypothetical protein